MRVSRSVRRQPACGHDGESWGPDPCGRLREGIARNAAGRGGRGRGVHRAVGRPCEGPTAQTGDGQVGPTAVHGRDGRAQAESERASHG